MKAVITATDIHQNETVAATAERFKRMFNAMKSGNIGNLAEVYSQDAVFIDPFGRVEGLDNLTRHFEKLYTNVISCEFKFGDLLVSKNDACIPWVMTLRHPKLRGGKPLTVDGISRLQIAQGRVTEHRDYMDAGQMLYENLPVLGRVVRWVRDYAS